ncbi:MAG: acyloxyacyl hydrolase [Ramlibacter sp.]
MNFQRLLVVAWASACAGGLHAAQWQPRGAFIEGGSAAHGTYSATAGLVWPWNWQDTWHNAQVSGITEAYLSEWSARGIDERRSFTQVGVLPLVRIRFRGGASPWFVEGGIGASVTSPVYRTATKAFSTSFNFVDVVGIGRSLDARHSQELSLRLQHISNADIKKPNPGENFLQLRYAVAF